MFRKNRFFQIVSKTLSCFREVRFAFGKMSPARQKSNKIFPRLPSVVFSQLPVFLHNCPQENAKTLSMGYFFESY